MGLIGPACETFNNNPPVIPDLAGYNLVPDTSCSFNGSADIVEPTDEFFALQNYGGSNRVVPPTTFNPAVDAANPALPDDADWSTCPESDARGLTRSGDGDADGVARCDIGAFEWPGEAPLFIDEFERGLLLVL